MLRADRLAGRGAIAEVGPQALDDAGDGGRRRPCELEIGQRVHRRGLRSEARQLGMRELAVVHVHLPELGAAVQRRHPLAGIEQSVRVERRLDPEEALELGGAELRAHAAQLLDADAVLAGDRAADVDAELEDRRAERLGRAPPRRRRWRRT